MQSLEERIAELRSTPIPSTGLVDALNAMALELWRVDLLRALATVREARTLSRLLSYHKGAITGLARLSWIHLQIGEFDTAVREAHETQFFAEQAGDYVLILNALYTITHAYQMAQDFKRAEASWQKMLNLAQTHGDQLRKADYWLSLGLLYLDTGRYQRALDLTLRAKELYTTLNDATLALAINNAAFALAYLGRNTEALTWAEDALARCDPEQSIWRAEFLNTIGVIRLNQEEYGLARACLDESLALSLAPGGRKMDAAITLMDMAKLELAQKNMPAAFNALERATLVAGEAQSHALEAKAQNAIAKLYVLAHDWNGADYYHDRYMGHKYRVGIDRVEKEVILIRVAAEVNSQHQVWERHGPLSL